MNSASRQPCSAPARASATTSSGVMYERSPLRGGFVKVQYRQTSRHSIVSGTNTFGEYVTSRGRTASRRARASAHSPAMSGRASSASASASAFVSTREA